MMAKESGGKVSSNFVKWFSELSNKDISVAGGKGASLAEMYNHKFPIPPGFMITAQAYAYFIEKTGLEDKIKQIIESTDIQDTKALQAASKKIRALIEGAELPEEMTKEILESYDILDVNNSGLENASRHALDILKKSKEPPFVAVRSSATTEDLADASFAGQQESFLNVKGHRDLIKNVKACFSSLFTARAIYYRKQKGFEKTKAYLSVVVQKMVDSDKSGVMFSRNPISDDDSIVIEAVWGLGEGIVSGMIKPDHYEIDKNLEEFKITKSEISEKKVAIVRDAAGTNQVVKLTEGRAKQQVLTSFEIKVLTNYARKLEEHYGKPQDIEFAISANDIYIVQSRPITTKFVKSKDNANRGEALLTGLGASPGIASGTVKIIHSLDELDKVKKGDVLVTEMTNPDMVVSMQRAAGIITDEGGITSHAAIVSREMGIPAVVGTGDATKKLKDGEQVTVDGNNGKIYSGKSEAQLVEIKPVVPTRTKVKVIVDLPDYAQRAALAATKGVGLVRLEGIIAESGKHPFYYVTNKNMNDYVKVISEGVEKISIPFNEVWVRTSDIRSDEYQHLEGAPKIVEGNPMLGNHGVRFSLKHKDIMSSELEGIRAVALKYPDKILGVMIPQVISVNEVKETMELGQKMGMPPNVKFGIMVETPAAVQVINNICELGIKFISFGTNDLTQYMLAIDRNNEHVQYIYDETNPAVLSAISYVIRRCKKFGVETSICGQAGSRPEMIKFLMGEGIDGVTVNADAAFKVSQLISECEKSISSSSYEPEDQKLESGENEVEGIKDIENPQIELAITEEIVKPAKEVEKPLLTGERIDKLDINKDIEDIMLKELESDEYSPSIKGKGSKGEIPALNDAIPVDSSAFDD
jgi:pyruvate,water dikinase